MLVLIRHGQTEWVRENRFAGWSDAPLSAAGREEAAKAGRALAAQGLNFDLCQTSFLSRARETLEIILDVMGLKGLAVATSWRLNERHYGALQGQNRAKATLAFGKDSIAAWRRDYRARPPAQDRAAPDHPLTDPRYKEIDPALLPETESLEDAALRVLPWWDEEIKPRLTEGRRLLVVAHTASLRGLVRRIDGLNDEETEAFRITTCLPIVYRFDPEMHVRAREEITVDLKGAVRRIVNKYKPGKAIPWI